MTEPGPGTEIRVTVTLDGGGASGVSVRLFTQGGTTPVASVNTSATGQATFGDLAAGTYEVEVVLPTGVDLEEGAARRPVTVSSGSTASLTFRLVTLGDDLVVVRVTASLTFNPSQVTVQPGQTVRWVNDDGTMLHTVTPQGHSQWSEATLSQAGATFEHTFNAAGDFPYFCAPHLGAGMTGTVRVQ